MASSEQTRIVGSDSFEDRNPQTLNTGKGGFIQVICLTSTCLTNASQASLSILLRAWHNADRTYYFPCLFLSSHLDCNSVLLTFISPVSCRVIINSRVGA